MPLYEYLCESCGRTIEAIQSFAEPPLAVCDRCAGRLKKLVSAPAFQFKGTGWYVSDYGPSRSTPKTPEDVKSEGESRKEAAGAGDAYEDSPSKDSSEKSSSKKTSSKKDSSERDSPKKTSSKKDS